MQNFNLKPVLQYFLRQSNQMKMPPAPQAHTNNSRASRDESSSPEPEMGEVSQAGSANEIICAACLFPVTSVTQNYCSTECRHHYHQNCLDQWLKQKAACSLCRQKISKYFSAEKGEVQIPDRIESLFSTGFGFLGFSPTIPRLFSFFTTGQPDLELSSLRLDLRSFRSQFQNQNRFQNILTRIEDYEPELSLIQPQPARVNPPRRPQRRQANSRVLPRQMTSQRPRTTRVTQPTQRQHQRNQNKNRQASNVEERRITRSAARAIRPPSGKSKRS